MDSPESWEAARAYAALLGDVPTTFATALRNLVADQERNKGELSQISRFNALRLIKGRNLKAPYYYAVLTFKPEHLAGMDYVSDEELLRSFKPIEIAAIFGLIYLYKKAHKLCDKAEWDFIAPHLTHGYELGGSVGLAIPKVGMAAGLFATTLRYLALSAFLRHNKKHFQEFRRSLKDSPTMLNLNAELIGWGCTDLQVASIFLQSLGFGVEYANSYVIGLSNEGSLSETKLTTSPFKVAEIWIWSLATTGSIPPIVHESSYHPSGENARLLSEQAARYVKEGSLHNWIDKGTEDISPERTPQLFRDGVKVEAAQQPTQTGEVVNEEEMRALEEELT